MQVAPSYQQLMLETLPTAVQQRALEAISLHPGDTTFATKLGELLESPSFQAPTNKSSSRPLTTEQLQLRALERFARSP